MIASSEHARVHRTEGFRGGWIGAESNDTRRGGVRRQRVLCAADHRMPKKKQSTSRSRPARRTGGATRRRTGTGRPRQWRRQLRRLLPALITTSLLLAVAWVFWLDYRIVDQFEGRRWALPARVFARPLELHAGKGIAATDLVAELKLLRYREVSRVRSPGEYRVSGGKVYFHSRGFPFPGEEPQGRLVRADFEGRDIRRLRDASTGAAIDLLRVEPVPIASIYPGHGEDRMLVRLEDVPPLLIDALLVVEDRRFREHHGVDPAAIARAMVANLRAGRAVQGGSTLTQQLIKNYFLTNDRTLSRKLNEAVMSLLLEAHYDKDEILGAYLNEVYLGQDGDRAIHGFALAAQFYFERRLVDLGPDQIALLVATVKGPSYYDPRRRPERATGRRNLVIDLLEASGALDAEAAVAARERPLGVTASAPTGRTPFPAFLQLVRKQLLRDYQEEDLREEGLKIFTTMDPLVQVRAERAMKESLPRLTGGKKKGEEALQVAVVVTGPGAGEVKALIGGRDPRFAGYNRALAAIRPVGSLIKPVVYLAALERPGSYTLATMLDDGPLTVNLANGKQWSPRNYDRKSHGSVSLHDALVYSYNQSTARLGMEVGVESVARLLGRLGIDRPVPAYPSLLLGAVELSPLEVSQVYQGLADGGYSVPLNAIRSVANRDGETLNRYPLRIRQAVDADSVFLVTSALRDVTVEGTGKSLRHRLPGGLQVAGKTGTTNDYRDSWFAGYAGDYVTVVWLGRDDNRPTRLTGSSGALVVWADIMRKISSRPLVLDAPEGVVWQQIDPATGLRADAGCAGTQRVPFIRDSQPVEIAPCARRLSEKGKSPLKWLKGLLN
ncbi:MAG: penicillin-binding protein 1B [Pseudomonadota bacterium]|nr:penicillin-binding protein 1B [Pseudomonadota bacterium]